jgi:hypothetical protein
MATLKNPTKQTKFVWSCCFAGAILLAVVAFLVKWWDDLAALSALLGGVGGWVLGTLASPYGKKDQERFGAVGKAASAFLSGFLLSKFDRIFNLAVPEGGHPQFLFDEKLIRRLLVGLICLVVSTMIVFISRQYYPIDLDDGTAGSRRHAGERGESARE